MSSFKIAVAQTAPVFLDREATIDRVVRDIEDAAARGAALVAFGEALVPAYPVWLDRTGGAQFNDADQKRLFARYADEAVDLEAGDLDRVCRAAADGSIHVVLGIVERPRDRGGHTLYCTVVVIGDDGTIRSAHRKLMPTYEERLVWGTGDGAGLITHSVGPFTMGALNCWENWMPLARASLQAQGEDLHVAVWPGCTRLTQEITRYIACEGRSYVISASGLLRAGDIPADVPLREQIVRSEDEVLMDGGSAVAGPDGSWVLAPLPAEESVVLVELDPARVREERQNFDPAGHYSRPDVLELLVDRRRRRILSDRPD